MQASYHIRKLFHMPAMTGIELNLRLRSDRS
jgi:hypothetical protein